MNLDQLLERSNEIDAAIVNMTAQLNGLQGHKAETAHWIQQLQSKADIPMVESPEEPMVQ